MRFASFSSGLSFRPHVRVLERPRREVVEVFVLVRVMEGVVDVGVVERAWGVDVPVAGCEGTGVFCDVESEEFEPELDRSERLRARRKRSLRGIVFVYLSREVFVEFSAAERICLYVVRNWKLMTCTRTPRDEF